MSADWGIPAGAPGAFERRDAHILVAHPASTTRAALAGIVARRGYTVAEAADFDEAAATIAQGHIDAILAGVSLLTSEPSILAVAHDLPAVVAFDESAPEIAKHPLDDPRVVAGLGSGWQLRELDHSLQLATWRTRSMPAEAA